MVSTGPARLLAAAISAQHLCFAVYHHNSYAANPAMLRSPKPLMMRDVFLTKATAPVPNPLSCLYVPTAWSLTTQLAAAWAIGIGAASQPGIGALHALAVYIVGGMFTGFAYLFQAQTSKTKLQTKYDCNASSAGAWCALAAVSWWTPQAQMPLLRRKPLWYFSVPYVGACLSNEYIVPWLFPSPEGHAQVTNWGAIGGVFCGLIYGRLLLGRRADAAKVGKFFRNFEAKGGAPPAA